MKRNLKRVMGILLSICLLASVGINVAYAENAQTETVWESAMDIVLHEEQGFAYVDSGSIKDSEAFDSGKWTSQYNLWEGDFIGLPKSSGFEVLDLKSAKNHWWNPYHKLDENAPAMEFSDPIRITMEFTTAEISKIINPMQIWLTCLTNSGNGMGENALFAIRKETDENGAPYYQSYTASQDGYSLNAQKIDCDLADNTNYTIIVTAKQNTNGETYDLSYSLIDNQGTTVARASLADYHFFDPEQIIGLGFNAKNNNGEEITVAGSGERFATVNRLAIEKAVEATLPTATFTPANGSTFVPITDNVVVKFDKAVKEITTDNIEVTNGAAVTGIIMDSDAKGAVIKLSNISKNTSYTVTLTDIYQKGGSTPCEFSTSFRTAGDLYVEKLYQKKNRMQEYFNTFNTNSSLNYGGFAYDTLWDAGKLWAYEVPEGDGYTSSNCYDFSTDNTHSLIEGKDGKLVFYNNNFHPYVGEEKPFTRQAVLKKIPTIDVDKHQNMTVSMDIWHSSQTLNDPKVGVYLANSSDTWVNSVFYATGNGSKAWQAFYWGVCRAVEGVDGDTWQDPTKFASITWGENVSWRADGWCKLTADFQYNETTTKYDMTVTLTGIDKEGSASCKFENVEPEHLAQFDCIKFVVNGGEAPTDDKYEILKIDNVEVKVGDGKDSLVTGDNTLKFYYNNTGDAKTVNAFKAVYSNDNSSAQMLKRCTVEPITLNSGEGIIELSDIVLGDPNAEQLKVYLFDDNLVPFFLPNEFEE